MIKIKCFYSGIIYYSKIINKNYYYKEPCYDTWKKYHCNAIINDIIKCQICKNSFIYNEDKNILICLKCHKELNPLEIKFTCFLCKKEFISEIKIYNPLEYKMIKISIKDALIKKENAFPKYMGCKCNLDINNTHFFHKVECDGDLYFGEINKKKLLFVQNVILLVIMMNLFGLVQNVLKDLKLKKIIIMVLYIMKMLIKIFMKIKNQILSLWI